MINYQYFPKNTSCPEHLLRVVEVFEGKSTNISSLTHKLPSNDVLAEVEVGLRKLGYTVESGKKKQDKITIPVLHGLNGKVEKSFDADAYNASLATVIEVEAGRAVTNYQFLKDLFQASMMQDVNYLVIAVRNTYNSKNDFDMVTRFFNTMYASQRLEVPLQGILVVGY